jgi:hypothetical protein
MRANLGTTLCIVIAIQGAKYWIAIAVFAVVGGATGRWLLNRDDAAAFPPTVERLTQWLKEADACLSVKAEYSRLPVKPNGPRGTAFQEFGDAPIAAALIGCEALGGYIAYYLFPNHQALLEGVRTSKHESVCVSGNELLVDGILGYDPTLEFCKRLGFAVHRAQP